MKKKIKYITTSLTFRVVVSTLMVIFLFECIVSGLGYYQFTATLTREYQDSAFRTADTKLNPICREAKQMPNTRIFFHA